MAWTCPHSGQDGQYIRYHMAKPERREISDYLPPIYQRVVRRGAFAATVGLWCMVGPGKHWQCMHNACAAAALSVCTHPSLRRCVSAGRKWASTHPRSRIGFTYELLKKSAQRFFEIGTQRFLSVQRITGVYKTTAPRHAHGLPLGQFLTCVANGR